MNIFHGLFLNIGDCLNKRNEKFKQFIPIEPEKKFAKGQKSFLKRMLLEWQLNRDAWVYNFSSHSVAFNMKRMIDFYNKQQEEYSQAIKNNPSLNVEDFVEQDPTKISWTRSLRNSILT